jgi:hypothetical protein
VVDCNQHEAGCTVMGKPRWYSKTTQFVSESNNCCRCMSVNTAASVCYMSVGCCMWLVMDSQARHKTINQIRHRCLLLACPNHVHQPPGDAWEPPMCAWAHAVCAHLAVSRCVGGCQQCAAQLVHEGWAGPGASSQGLDGRALRAGTCGEVKHGRWLFAGLWHCAGRA